MPTNVSTGTQPDESAMYTGAAAVRHDVHGANSVTEEEVRQPG